ncbi:MAG: hypothetical protein HDT21_09110 [Ruminococcus sp.]|nr:hypothetical protein [Ruminococcus sp.]
MKKLRGLGFSLSEHIPAARWCLALAVTAFTAAVSVRKYIDLADTAAFSSFEALFMMITDITNIVFIYLPLYLFTVCGIMFGNDFGGIDILRCGSRGRWLAGKAITYAVNTVLFFAAVFAINLAVCSRTFSFSDVWSSGFVGFRVMTGSPAADFAAPPLPTIMGAAFSALLLYLFCGMINMFFSLVTGRESAALFVSLFAGIALGLLNMMSGSNSCGSQLLRCLVLAVSAAAVYVFSAAAVGRKDLGSGKTA